MSTPPLYYSRYYSSPSEGASPLAPLSPIDLSDSIPLVHPTPVHHRQQKMVHQSMPPPSPQIPLDPALALYPPYYAYHQQQQQQQQQQPMQSMHHQQVVALAPVASSPSSHGSDGMGTPPLDPMSYMGSYGGHNANGKRPSTSSIISVGGDDSRKRARHEDDDDDVSVSADKADEPKPKPTRGSR
jgi:hypothetical protein